MKATICVGISGSGKSTWAERQWDSKQDYPTKVINRDETRWALSGKLGWNGPNRYKFDKEIEKAVTSVNLQKIYDAAIEGKDIIIADTNLNEINRRGLEEACAELGYEVEIREFPISFQEACKRDAARGIFSVGEAVLMKQWTQWVKYHEEKQQGAW